ncbi:plasmid recombination protein [Vibrio diabolicus]|uniref:plasmid recombination protein n=1 Tax=Vibrio diabolicus TaxID=50719 RepID=UPI0037513EE5
MRDPSAIPHVANPEPPKLLFGVDAYEVERIARERTSKAKDAIGRKLRKDAQVVLSAVASVPSSLPEEELKRWTEQTILWFKRKYGENFISAILHRDESHPHLHLCVVIPDSQEYGMANLKHIHAPLAARQDTQGGRKAKADAYKKAYRQIQDDYHNEVSSSFGMLRLGAHKQRLTRAEYNTRKHQAKCEAEVIRKIHADKTEVEIKINEIEKSELIIKNKIYKIKEEGSLLLIELSKQNKRPRLFYMKKVNKFKKDIKEYKELYILFRKKYLRLKNAHDVLIDERDKFQKENIEIKEQLNKTKSHLKKIKKGEASLKLTPTKTYDLD